MYNYLYIHYVTRIYTSNFGVYMYFFVFYLLTKLTKSAVSLVVVFSVFLNISTFKTSSFGVLWEHRLG